MKKTFLTMLMLLMAFFSCHVCAKEPVNVALKKPVTASNQEAANPAAHMTDGNTATITFRYVGDGLKAIRPNGGQLLGFEGVTTSGQPISVSAEIVGKNQIKLTASQNLAGVRYAYFRYATLHNANMANSAGKLMLPFTDGAEAQSFTMGALDTVHTPAENY